MVKRRVVRQVMVRIRRGGWKWEVIIWRKRCQPLVAGRGGSLADKSPIKTTIDNYWQLLTNWDSQIRRSDRFMMIVLGLVTCDVFVMFPVKNIILEMFKYYWHWHQCMLQMLAVRLSWNILSQQILYKLTTVMLYFLLHKTCI